MSKPNTNNPPHLLLFPYPAQGHMLPLLDFTHQLAVRSLTITILITPKNLPILTPLLTLHPSIQTLVLPFPTHPSIPPGIENVKDLSFIYFRPMVCVMGELYQPLLSWFRSHSSPPIAIISDFFLGWTHHLAIELGIPRIVFSPSGALALAVFDYLFRYLPKPDGNNPIQFPGIPNSPSYPWWQLYLLYRTYKEGDPESEFVRDGFLANSASWGLVVNSFDELEHVYFDHVRKSFSNAHVWAVGPLLPSSSGPKERYGGSEPNSVNDVVLSWLDTCPDHSVVYVCFGSQVVLNNNQIEELAAGLEQSGVRFVWCVKEPTIRHVSGDYGEVPVGFEQRVAGKGVVIRRWAPQVLILRHRAVGAFMTHCGWNSVLEAIVAGVPMLTWPMIADQFVNATLLVDELGVGVRVCEGLEMIPNAVELAKALEKSVSEDSMERVRAIDLREAALGSVKKGRNSFKELDDFVRALCEVKEASK